MNWTLKDDPHATDALEAHLLADLRANLPQGPNIPVTLAAHDNTGTLIGGVSGATSYGWMLIKLLWVAEPFRSRGLGSSLLTAMEARAVELGCHGAWLDSSNPASVYWYLRRGYEAFGTLANTPPQSPPGHCRAFLRKSLTH